MAKRKRTSAHPGATSTHQHGEQDEHGRTFKYRNRTIELLDEPGHVHVKIDGEHLHAARVGPGAYHSHTLMYQEFPTLESLARALVETQGTLWLPAGHPVGHPFVESKAAPRAAKQTPAKRARTAKRTAR